jgi:hypothetical protein
MDNRALVVQAEWSEIKGEGYMKIVKQKYERGNFYKGAASFSGSNGTILKSVGAPQLHGPDGWSTMYVRGNCRHDDNKTISTTDKNLFDKLLVTINEYNEVMARPKVVALTQSQKDGIVSYSKDIASRAASIFATFATNINQSTDMDSAMKAKVRLMTGLLGCVPMGIDTCPFCVLNGNACEGCTYKDKHGICSTYESAYMETSNKIRDLKEFINENYWKGM